MKVNASRIENRIEKVATFNSEKGAGISRFSYSQSDRDVKDWLFLICTDMGLNPQVDAVGNVRVSYKGTDERLAPIYIGSHIDSVKNGGKYDGVVGVIGALETISTFYDNAYRPKRGVELIIFAEEEGSNFGTTMVGSKVMIGKLDYEGLCCLKTEDEKSAVEVMESFGLEPENCKSCLLNASDIDSMIELHIEQGIVLEREKKTLGVVQAIAGMTTLEVTVTGESNHAGSTPMNMRCDPMQAAACLINEIESIAKEKVNDTTVATVGTISCLPGMPNVIVKTVTFTIDIRDIYNEGIHKAEELIRQAAKQIDQSRGVTTTFSLIGANDAVTLSPRIIDAITKAAEKTKAPWMNINSGAVHDAAALAKITDVGMIFVPSKGGISHSPFEDTDMEDIVMGCQVLLDAVILLTE